MKLAYDTFIKDFKNSKAYDFILADSQVDVIMIWITGSALTGVLDSESDYDLCVLCMQKPSENLPGFRLYTRPGSYFLKYKLENKKVQWIYNDISDITNISKTTPLDNIGWAQFKEVSADHIIYKNPKYNFFIDYLLAQKEQIFLNSAYLFVEALLAQLKSNTLLDLINYKPYKPNKGLYHVCWLADTLQEKPLVVDRLLRLKRNLVLNLSKEDLEYLEFCCQYLMKYREQFDKRTLDSIDLIKALQESR